MFAQHACILLHSTQDANINLLSTLYFHFSFEIIDASLGASHTLSKDVSNITFWTQRYILSCDICTFSFDRKMPGLQIFWNRARTLKIFHGKCMLYSQDIYFFYFNSITYNISNSYFKPYRGHRSRNILNFLIIIHHSFENDLRER